MRQYTATVVEVIPENLAEYQFATIVTKEYGDLVDFGLLKVPEGMSVMSQVHPGDTIHFHIQPPFESSDTCWPIVTLETQSTSIVSFEDYVQSTYESVSSLADINALVLSYLLAAAGYALWCFIKPNFPVAPLSLPLRYTKEDTLDALKETMTLHFGSMWGVLLVPYILGAVKGSAPNPHAAALFLLIILLIVGRSAINKNALLLWRQAEELHPNMPHRRSVCFTEDAVFVTNHDSGNTNELTYVLINKCILGKKQLLFQTKAKQFFCLPANTLSPTETQALILFLKTKNPKIKFLQAHTPVFIAASILFCYNIMLVLFTVLYR